jgi:Ribosomal protein L9, N-terminal domain
MAKRTKLVLSKEVRKLGKLGDVVEVAPRLCPQLSSSPRHWLTSNPWYPAAGS